MSDQPKLVRNLLIIDDEKGAADAVARYFRLVENWHPQVAQDGDSALRIVTEEQIDVALIDIRMPGMNGLEVLKRIKEKAPRCVSVMLTAVDDAAIAVEALKLGAFDYVNKPVVLHELERTILSALEKDRLVRENHDYQVNLEAKVAEQTAALRSVNEELKQANREIVVALSGGIEAKDEYTKGHSYRVTKYALALGAAVGLDEGRLKTLEVGALLHDIGKIGVLDAILHAPRQLTDEEFLHVKRHPVVGFNIVENIAFLGEAKMVIRNHHERFDGGGYPDALAGENISLLARITGVADVFDALTSDRPYRTAFGLEDALGMLQEMAGDHLDAQLVALFLDKSVYRVEGL